MEIISNVTHHASRYFIDRWIINPDYDDVLANYDWRCPLYTVAAYIFMVKWAGPALMRGHKPFELNFVMILFNALIVIVNGTISFKFFGYIYKYWDDRCLIMQNTKWEYIKLEVFYMCYLYHLSKYADLLDTLFFVLRKKENQVSFLHVFHHAAVIIVTYYPMKEQIFGFYMSVVLSLNAAVHVLTYSYYTLAALGPRMRKHLWWKRYLTLVQIVQFWLILGYIAYAWHAGCEQFSLLQTMVIFFLVFLFFLFCNYYIVHFVRQRKREVSVHESGAQIGNGHLKKQL